MSRVKKERSALNIIALTLVLTAAGIAVPGIPGPSSAALKVALIFDIGGRGDGGFNDLAFRGLDRAVKELGVEAVLREPRRNLEREVSLNEAAASDAGLIIGVGFNFSDRLNDLASRYPGKKFVCIDYGQKFDATGRPVLPPANLAGLRFREEEGSYLVGVIAALKSRTGRIGFLGGMDGPVIRRFEAGYRAGAVSARPGIIIDSKFAGMTARAFNDPAKGYEIAAAMYKNGADVVYHAAGGTGAGLFRAAREAGRWAIGVDVDQSALAPGLVVTSMTKNVDVAVYESIKAAAAGRFAGGLKTFGLKENGVGFVSTLANKDLIPAEVLAKAQAARERIISGKIAVPASGRDKPRIEQRELQAVLFGLKVEIASVVDLLDADLKRSAAALAGTGLVGVQARAILKQLYDTQPYIIDCDTVSDRGVMLTVEPAEHRASEGSDISAQAHMVRLFATRKPVISGLFSSVEGLPAIAFHHPIFAAGEKFIGSISALFSPEYLLASIIGPISSNLPVDIFLMQTDGLVLYDADPKQVGLNVFTDPMYRPFPELRALAERVAAEREGTGEYRFLEKGAGPATIEVAFWRTVDVHGTEWRLVITCAKDSIVK